MSGHCSTIAGRNWESDPPAHACHTRMYARVFACYQHTHAVGGWIEVGDSHQTLKGTFLDVSTCHHLQGHCGQSERSVGGENTEALVCEVGCVLGTGRTQGYVRGMLWRQHKRRLSKPYCRTNQRRIHSRVTLNWCSHTLHINLFSDLQGRPPVRRKIVNASNVLMGCELFRCMTSLLQCLSGK